MFMCYSIIIGGGSENAVSSVFFLYHTNLFPPYRFAGGVFANNQQISVWAFFVNMSFN